MNRKEAFKSCKRDFPDLKAVLPGGYTGDSLGNVFIPLYKTKMCLVVYNETDLWRIMAACNAALEIRKKRKRGLNV